MVVSQPELSSIEAAMFCSGASENTEVSFCEDCHFTNVISIITL